MLKLWLIAAQPVVAVGYAGHDDRLFLDLAKHLLDGEWLGPYSQFTLMKGPMYPLWIAGTVWAGIPLPLSQHLLYLAGCWLLVMALRSQIAKGWQAFGLFSVLWWNPMTYELPVLGRVLRQNIYTPLGLLLFAALIGIYTHRHATLRIRLAWGSLFGASGAALWLTREETIWAFPSIALLVAAGFWFQKKDALKASHRWYPLILAVALGGFMVGTVCLLNYEKYGWFGTVEFRAPEFLAGYGALQRVMPERPMRYVPVTREAREKIYWVSPAFAELRTYLEGTHGAGWAEASRSVTGLPGSALEIGGGWFMWALRDAVVATGHASTAHSALIFYAQIGREVNEACDAGKLPCTRQRDSMIPRWGPGHFSQLKWELPGYLKYFFLFEGFSARPAASSGNATTLQLFRDLTRWSLSPSPDAPELDNPETCRVDLWRIEALQVFGKFFCALSTLIGIAGLVACGWSLAISLRLYQVSYALVVSIAAFAASGASVAINFVVHIMSFLNRSTGAFAQAYPLLLLGGTMALCELSRLIQISRRGNEVIR
jgi:hypothetical protein